MTPEQEKAHAELQVRILEYIKSKHTKQLLDILQSCRKCGGYYDLLDNNSGFVVTIEQVRAELATREHIPNKQEAKAIRQAKAKGR